LRTVSKRIITLHSSTNVKTSLKNNKKNKKEYIQSYLMILPQLIGFCVFTIYPIAWVVHLGWFSYDGVTKTYIGWENFIRLFTRDPMYWSTLLNTFVLAIGKLIVELPLALILAVILNLKLKGRSFFRAMFYMPNVISSAIIGIIFYFMFASFEGIVNNILLALKFISEPINWFGSKSTAMFVIAVAAIWQGFGINMLFFLSALQNIPEELYECADIDGANKFRQFLHITVPMLAPVSKVIFMLAFIGSLKITDLVLVLTNGQPAGQTEVVMTYIFKYFFTNSEGSSSQIGYASALGLVTSIIIGLVTVFYLKMMKKTGNIY